MGRSITFDLVNSAGIDTPGLVIVGFDEAAAPTNKGGTILVQKYLMLPVLVPAAGLSLAWTIPNDTNLCDVKLYLQALELDAGASHGVSFTPGLCLCIGG